MGCKPIRKVGFLKMIKCASTTIQNMLLRYSVKHNLNVVLPEQHRDKDDPQNLKFEYSVQNLDGIEVQPQFSRKQIEGTVWEKAHLEYHMFILHTRWNHDEISSVLSDQGKGDVFYFSILRDPVLLYRSYWDYFGLSRKFGNTLDEYAKTVISKYVLSRNMTYCLHGYNQMLTGFGMYCHDMMHQEKTRTEKLTAYEHLQKKVDEIAQKFNLILLADEEHYDDGMILLKEALCWDFEDIINVPHNVYPATQRSYLSKEAKAIIKGIKHVEEIVISM